MTEKRPITRRRVERRLEEKGKKFQPERHLPQLRGMPGTSIPKANPLVSLLRSALQGPRGSNEMEGKMGSDRKESLLSEIRLGGGGGGGGGEEERRRKKGEEESLLASISAFSSTISSSPWSSSAVDGPIRRDPEVDSQLLFHPFDEVSVVNPSLFASQNSISLDLSDGFIKPSSFSSSTTTTTTEEEEQESINSTSQDSSAYESTKTCQDSSQQKKHSEGSVKYQSAADRAMASNTTKKSQEEEEEKENIFGQSNLNSSSSSKKVKPITSEEFEEVCKRLGMSEANGIVAAVSGGPDSMAMAILLADFCLKKNIPLLCVTVDHALRPEAPAEALVTQTWLHSLGIPHAIVRVQWPSGHPPSHGVQVKARDTRYEAVTKVASELQQRIELVFKQESSSHPPSHPEHLQNSSHHDQNTSDLNILEQNEAMEEEYKEEKMKEGEESSASFHSASPDPPPSPFKAKIHIVMAHMADDNVETFWLRLAGCSGLYGLAGIAEKRLLQRDIFLSRPLLSFSKLRLYATLIAADQPWASDPSNAKMLYKRNRIRHTLSSLFSSSSPSSPNLSPNTSPTDSSSSETHHKSTGSQKSNKSSKDPNLSSKGPIASSSPKKSSLEASSTIITEEEGRGVSLEEMMRLQTHFSKARFLLDDVTHRFCRNYVTISKRYGYVVLPTQVLLHLPEIFRMRMLDAILGHVSGQGAPMRLKSLRTCLEKIEETSKWMDVVEEEGGGEKREKRKAFAETPQRKVSPHSSVVSTIHGCVIIQSPRKLTVAMQNLPNAPAALVGGKTPLPPFRADHPLPLSSSIHWLGAWKISYSRLPRSDALSISLATHLPETVFIRQMQPDDIPLLRSLGNSFTSWSQRLHRHVLLALPVIVDEHSNLLAVPFLLKPDASAKNRTLSSLPDQPGVSSLSARFALEHAASVVISSLPSLSISRPPASSFLGYHDLSSPFSDL